VRRRNGRIRLGDRWVAFPPSPRDLASTLPVGRSLALASGAVRATLTAARDDTFADVVRTGLGRPMGELFYFPYARKIWGLDPTLLSGDQARRRISADTPWKLLRRALTRGHGRTFLYPAGGFGRIPDAIADAARSEGADLRTGSAVTGLANQEGRWSALAGGEPHTGDLVLSTLPLTVLARLLAPPPAVVAALSSLVSRAMVLVYLTVASPRWTPYDAHYFPGEDVPFTRISEPKNYRDGPLDPPDRTVLCVEIPCAVDDRWWTADDQDLAAAVRTAILSLGLPDPGAAATVSRIRHAYPVHGLGAAEALATVDEWIAGRAGLITFGRQGLFAHDNTHHALAMARDAVDCIGADLTFDGDRWSRARDRYALHVVED
jgi:protoporphyrinogen oxidase